MSPIDPEEAARIRRRLLTRYDQDRRELPWRGEEDPYRIWVSEVMLQQTRVKTVIPYYRRWMERFPGLEELAEAEQTEVLRLWEGLGYYARARNLHQAARTVRERHDGELPETAEELRELPGVGPYTAGALASIAFDLPEPAVDGNVRRVLSRLYDLVDPSPSRLRKMAAGLVDPDRPGDFNEALMEHGAVVCTPRAPDCAGCALSDLCRARARGTVEERPRSRRRGRVTSVEIGVAVLLRANRSVLVVRRPEEGLLGGLWEFPGERCRPGEEPRDAAFRAIRNRSSAVDGPVPDQEDAPGLSLEAVTHRYSHLKATYHPFLFPLPTHVRSGETGEGVRWIGLSDLERLPLPVAQRRIGEAVELSSS